VAPDGFDARFSAVWRRYAYRICDSPAGADPLARRYVLAWPRRLDEEAMEGAAALLTGEHDFAAFCRRRAGATTVRALQRLDAHREGDDITLLTYGAMVQPSLEAADRLSKDGVEVEVIDLRTLLIDPSPITTVNEGLPGLPNGGSDPFGSNL